MSELASLIDRSTQERPAYVRFEKRPIEDKAESIKQGRYVAKDVDFANIQPSYSKDVIVQKVSAWFAQMDQDVNMGRLPPQWRDAYHESYKRWQNGQEMPPTGTAIRGWGVISPAQQENLIRMNILTVEDLAHVNDEGARRIGLGWLELKEKAVAWLKQLDDKGPLTIEMAELKKANANLTAQNEALIKRMEMLSAQVGALAQVQTQSPQIQADDILPEVEQPVRRRK